MKLKPVFITAIGTGIGKTVASAVLCEHLEADYWKPVQSGDLENSDTETVRSLVSNELSIFHRETYRLTEPFSPHKSAAIDGVKITLDAFELPLTSNRLIIEGAGGLMVPLNDEDLIIDLIAKLDAGVVLVTRHYLGSINHTLMSIEMIRSRGLKLLQLIVAGDRDEYSERIFRQKAGAELMFIPEFQPLDKASVKSFAATLNLTSDLFN